MELFFAITYFILAIAEGSIIIMQASNGNLTHAIIWLFFCIGMALSSGVELSSYIIKKIG